MEITGEARLFERLNYRFSDPSLFRQSVAHKSFTNENPTLIKGDNERLEFLGDAVLDLVISELLMSRYPHLSEGELSKIRAHLVNEAGLAEIARELNLGECLLIGKGEAKSGGPRKNSILADALEALFAAIYLDSRDAQGTNAVCKVIDTLFSERMAVAEQTLLFTDYKTELQELVQRRYKETVNYAIIREVGPDHEKQFEAVVSFRDREFGRGTGGSKKQAEQAAAKEALQIHRQGGLNLSP
ncbi:MAG: ribonuclease III [SAR324 cluster bacterium]|nr:ribonuclease III [SAR324 cluster bacterium]